MDDGLCAALGQRRRRLCAMFLLGGLTLVGITVDLVLNRDVELAHSSFVITRRSCGDDS